VKIKYNEFIKSTGLGKHFGWLDVKLTHSVGFSKQVDAQEPNPIQ
jgi:hypothetical protein